MGQWLMFWGGIAFFFTGIFVIERAMRLESKFPKTRWLGALMLFMGPVLMMLASGA